MDIREVRLQRLTELLKAYNNNKAALARALKKAPAQVSQWFNGVRTISEDTARDIERAVRLPVGWLDQGHGIDYPAQASVVTQEPSEHYGWPFSSVSSVEYYRLPAEDRDRIESHVRFVISEWRARAGQRGSPPAAAA